jgi:hypothetical protein
MRHFPCGRVALATALLAASLMLGWTSSAAASRYIDREPSAPIAQIAGNGSGSDGFDWFDAGIGAAAVVGLGLVGGGACVLVLRHRRAAAFS